MWPPRGYAPIGLPLGRLPQAQVCNVRPRGGRQQLDFSPSYWGTTELAAMCRQNFGG